jgi:hypothetical protein
MLFYRPIRTCLYATTTEIWIAMKIRHLFKTISLLLMLALVSPAVSAAPTKTPTEADAARATVLKNRLEEIKAIDKSGLSRKEKKVLREEVRAIKQEMASISGGVYLSIGAIILIVLLILLLA